MISAAIGTIPTVIPHATAVIVGSAAPATGHPSYAPFIIVIGAIAVGFLLRLAWRSMARWRTRGSLKG